MRSLSCSSHSTKSRCSTRSAAHSLCPQQIAPTSSKRAAIAPFGLTDRIAEYWTKYNIPARRLAVSTPPLEDGQTPKRRILIAILMAIFAIVGTRSWCLADPPSATVSEEDKLADEVDDPLSKLTQFQLKDEYTPAEYGTNAQLNTLQFRSVVAIRPYSLMPFDQLLRPTIQVVTVPRDGRPHRRQPPWMICSSSTCSGFRFLTIRRPGFFGALARTLFFRPRPASSPATARGSWALRGLFRGG